MIIIGKEFNVAPLSSTFVLFSIFGFLFSVFYVTSLNIKIGAAFTLLFLILFLASFVSMTKAPVGNETFINDLSIHEPEKHLRHKRKKKS